MFRRIALLFALVSLSSLAVFAQVMTTTAKDRRSVNITVYNSNIGLVRETRAVRLPAGGRFALRFADVAASIRPETVHLVSLTAPASLSVLEQNYQYDLLNPSKLLDKYVGREVTLVMRRYENSTEVLTPVKAVLMSNNNGQVWKIGGEIVINPTNIAETRLPEVPENLVATPTLVWDLENAGGAEQTLEASYLTGGMNWKADYVLVVDETDTRGDIQGWVTLTNQSGVGFEDARLQLVAGDLNRVREEYAPADGMAEQRKDAPRASVAGFKEQAFFEYHLYTLERPATVREQETKQLTLLEAADFAATKDYVINGQNYYYHGYNAPGQPVKEPVGVFVEFRNARENKLGMPLPAGVIRLYKRDAAGGQQFIGESRIAHTPKDEDVRVKVGDAFDIVAERKQTDYRIVTRRSSEYAYEITIRNHKDVPVGVVVNEAVGEGDWQIVAAGTTCAGSPRCAAFKPEKTSAASARLRVPVEADGETKVTYRVRVKY